MSIVRVEHVSHFFGKLQVLNDVSFSVGANEVMGFIGPNDMTQDYGKLDHFDDPEIVDAIAKVVASAKAHGKFSGAHFGASAPLLPWISRGMQLNMWSSDIGLMSLGAAAGLPALRDAGK